MSTEPVGHFKTKTYLHERDAFLAIQSIKKALLGLHRPSPIRGILKMIALVLLAAILLISFFKSSNLVISAGFLVLSALAYVLLAMNCHELSHGTVFGHKSLERHLGRIISWPIMWPFSTYALMHRSHHYFNGWSYDDPERKVPSALELDHASSLLKWHYRYPLLISIVIGGAGLLSQMLSCIRLTDFRQRKTMYRALMLDIAGISIIQVFATAYAVYSNSLFKYIIGLLFLVQIVGALIQVHRLIEHQAVWSFGAKPGILTQLYSSRNVACPFWINFLMGGLPYHATHHAFPGIPSANLPEATRRIDDIFANLNLKAVPQCKNYGQALALLIKLNSPPG